MFKNKLKRLCAVTLAGMMVVSVSACSTSKSAEKNNVSKAEQASEATTEAAKDDTTADYVASGVEPVSYTHLDVYKRQDLDSVVDIKKVINQAKAWGHPAMAITDHGVLQAFPIDVYKRQKPERLQQIRW